MGSQEGKEGKRYLEEIEEEPSPPQARSPDTGRKGGANAKMRRPNDAASEAQVRPGSTRKKSPAAKQVKGAPLTPAQLEEEKELAEVEWNELLTQTWNKRWWKENGALDTEKLEEGMKGGKKGFGKRFYYFQHVISFH